MVDQRAAWRAHIAELVEQWQRQQVDDVDLTVEEAADARVVAG